MRSFLGGMGAIFRRELAAYFFSPIAYVVVCLFLLVNGWRFYYEAWMLHESNEQIDFTIRSLYGWSTFWCLFLAPILSMRLLAEERRSGTLESLLTAPVSPLAVVLGKFLAAEAFFAVIWSTLLLHIIILAFLGNPDYGPVIAVNLGILAVGAAMLSLGILASAITRNQIIAAVMTFAGSLALMLVEMLKDLFPREPEADRFFSFLGILDHFHGELFRGVADLRWLALYLTFAAGAIFLSARVLAARR